MILLLCLYLVCLPLSLPSLYLAYRLVSKRFLGSVFNEHIAVMLFISGNQKLNYKLRFKTMDRKYKGLWSIGKLYNVLSNIWKRRSIYFQDFKNICSFNVLYWLKDCCCRVTWPLPCLEGCLSTPAWWVVSAPPCSTFRAHGSHSGSTCQPTQ